MAALRAKNFIPGAGLLQSEKPLENDFVNPACGECDIVVITSVRCMCLRLCMRVCIVCLGHNFYIYSWISK